MEVIWHRSLSGLVDKLVDSSARTTRAAYILFAKIVSLALPQASRGPDFDAAGGAVGWNCVETGMTALHPFYRAADWFRIIFWL